MVAILRSLVAAAALSLSGLVYSHPVEHVDRQAAAAVSPVGDRIVVDAGGIYMRTTVMEDGSLLGGYAGNDGDNRVLRVVRSTDGGNSWTRVGIVDSTLPDTREIDNAFPLALPGGRILYAFRNHDKSDTDSFTFYRITVCVSDDGGANWDFLSHVEQRAAAGKNGLWEPFLRQANDGSIQAYYSAENNANDQDNLMRVSTDGGLNWGSPITVTGANLQSRDGMMGIADAGNGRLICVFENTEDGPFSVRSVISTDDGLTWGSRSLIYRAVNNLEAGAPQVINVGGTLVTSFMSNEAGSGPGVDGGQMKMTTSTNGGADWSEPIVAAGLGSHWPGMQTLDDTTFLALYAFNGPLVSQRFSV